jgi:hypothetical protein
MFWGGIWGGMDPARIRGMQSNFPGENMTISGQPRVGCVWWGGGDVDVRSVLPAY